MGICEGFMLILLLKNLALTTKDGAHPHYSSAALSKSSVHIPSFCPYSTTKSLCLSS